MISRELEQFIKTNELANYSDILNAAGEFGEKELTKYDKNNIKVGVKALIKEGFVSASFPEGYGGLGLPYSVSIFAIDVLASYSAGITLGAAIHNTCCEGIRIFGNEEQKKEYLGDLLNGNKIAAFSLTEPNHGSDVGKYLDTKAVLENDNYTINGSKMFITNGSIADVYFLFAKTDKGHSAFIVDRETNGLTTGKNLEKLGMENSVTNEISLENCLVPKENLVGEEGQAGNYFKQMLNSGRVTIAAISNGIAQKAYNKSLRYSKERVQFGKPISEYQLIRERLANMLTKLDAGRAMTYYVARLKELDLDFSQKAAETKIFSSTNTDEISKEAILLHGGAGYLDETGIHECLRDNLLCIIGEGTNDILKLLIAQKALKEQSL